MKFSVQPDDIDRLLDYSREAGAERALAARVADLTFRESRRHKCEVPGCPSYLTNMHCPPKTPDARWRQSCLPQAYEYGILAVMYSPEQAVAFPHQLRGAGEWTIKTDKLAERIAIGFAGGACPRDGNSSAQRTAPLCLHFYHGRPAARAVGLDMYLTAKNVGWEKYLHPAVPVTDGRMDWPCLPGVYPVLVK